MVNDVALYKSEDGGWVFVTPGKNLGEYGSIDFLDATPISENGEWGNRIK